MRAGLLVAVAVCVAAAPAQGQLEGVADGSVVLQFAPRPGVCGDGDHYIKFGHSFMGAFRSGDRNGECVRGPVQVLVTLQNSEVTRVETWVGPVRTRAAGRPVVVSAPLAAKALLRIAHSSSGSVATKAIMPAVLADSAVVWPELLAIAREGRARSTRQDAAFWLSRFAAGAIAGKPNEILDDEDHTGTNDLKTHAVFVLSQLPYKEGVPALLDAARTGRDWPVRSAALFWLGQSGDERALDLFEALLRK